ncbi:hypothetical protein ACFQ1I_06795 [Kitasatospora arboriphila]
MTSEMPPIPWHKARRADTRQPLTPEAVVEAASTSSTAKGSRA